MNKKKIIKKKYQKNTKPKNNMKNKDTTKTLNQKDNMK